MEGTLPRPCPFCQKQTKRPRAFRQHMRFTCWRHCADPLWLDAYDLSCVGRRSHGIAAEALKEVAYKHEKELRAMNAFPDAVDLTAPRSRFAADYTLEDDDDGESDETNDNDPDPSHHNPTSARRCAFCSEIYDSQVVYREHLVQEEYKEYESPRWQKELYSTYPVTLAGAPVAFLRYVQGIRKRLGLTDHSTPKIRQTHSTIRLASTKADQSKLGRAFMDTLLSDSLLAWCAWYAMTEEARKCQVTAELAMLKPFDHLVELVQPILLNIQQEGGFTDEHLEALQKNFEGDERFKAALASYLSQESPGQQQVFLTTQCKNYLELIITWVHQVQDAWQALAQEIIQHATEQEWRHETDKVLRWSPDNTALFGHEEAHQVSVLQCLGLHYGHWLPIFLDLNLYTVGGEVQVNREMFRLRVLYGLNVAPLTIPVAEQEQASTDHT